MILVNRTVDIDALDNYGKDIGEGAHGSIPRTAEVAVQIGRWAMLKGEEPQEVFIAQTTSVQVYIDEDDVGIWRICRNENGKQVCSMCEIITIGPVTELICQKLPGLYRFAVAYIKTDGFAYAKHAKYNGDKVFWSEEVMEEGAVVTQWHFMN